MRLFELTQVFGGLPKEAGLAKLKWSDVYDPTRKGAVITLPKNYERVEFFPLVKMKQFLVVLTHWNGVQSVFFGGTDEQPFLVQLDESVIDSLRDGENAFFESIKPAGAKILEKSFDTTAVRQGDWFAVPMPITWKSALGLTGFNEIASRIVDEKRVKLLGTRHDFHAKRYIEMGRNSLNCALIGEGLLHAPDHEDRELKGIHALFQTAHLFSPQTAD